MDDVQLTVIVLVEEEYVTQAALEVNTEAGTRRIHAIIVDKILAWNFSIKG